MNEEETGTVSGWFEAVTEVAVLIVGEVTKAVANEEAVEESLHTEAAVLVWAAWWRAAQRRFFSLSAEPWWRQGRKELGGQEGAGKE